jgi:hypothetical protein
MLPMRFDELCAPLSKLTVWKALIVASASSRKTHCVLTPGWFPATAQSRDQPGALEIEYSLASHETFKLSLVSFRSKGNMRPRMCSNLGASVVAAPDARSF